MRNTSSMSPRIYLPLYCRWINRNCSSQLIIRYCSSRYLLRSSPLPLRPFNRSRICHRSCFRTLIPPLHRIYTSQHMNQNPLRSNVLRCKPHILPTTLPWVSWNASAVLRLSRRLHTMKYHFFHRLSNFPSCSNYVPLYYLRSIYC